VASNVVSIPKMGRKKRTEIVEEERRKLPVKSWVLKPEK
jgi:hypothetical protein